MNHQRSWHVRGRAGALRSAIYASLVAAFLVEKPALAGNGRDASDALFNGLIAVPGTVAALGWTTWLAGQVLATKRRPSLPVATALACAQGLVLLVSTKVGSVIPRSLVVASLSVGAIGLFRLRPTGTDGREMRPRRALAVATMLSGLAIGRLFTGETMFASEIASRDSWGAPLLGIYGLVAMGLAVTVLLAHRAARGAPSHGSVWAGTLEQEGEDVHLVRLDDGRLAEVRDPLRAHGCTIGIGDSVWIVADSLISTVEGGAPFRGTPVVLARSDRRSPRMGPGTLEDGRAVLSRERWDHASQAAVGTSLLSLELLLLHAVV